MGKHFWAKHVDNTTQNKQPGCIWGLVHALDYHHWHSNVRKIIHYHKYENETPSTSDSSPESKIHPDDANEVKKLSIDQSTKRSRAKKRSLRARIKALIAENGSKENENKKPEKPFSLKPNLQRTYSIHHLESLDDEFSKVPTDWNRPIIFVPKNLENRTNSDDSKPGSDVLDIFKVDKELLIKHLEDGDEGVANFTRSALGLNTKSNFSKSSSFPVAQLPQGIKVKPIKLEHKHNEVWSLPKEGKFQAKDEHDIEKGIHHSRSFSSESLDKYARLFEKSLRMDAKLHPSKSLKLTNEYGHAPINFRRISSLSNVDSYYSTLNFDVLGDDTFGNGSFVTAKDSNSGVQNCKEEEEIEIQLRDKENGSITNEKYEKELVHSEIAHEEIRDKDLMFDSDICFKETEFQAVDVQIYEGLEHKSCDLTGSDEHKSLHNSINLENNKIFETIDKCCPENDLYYVRHILDRSGIAVDASERTWHTIDQPLGPQLFEEIEARFHDQDESIGCDEFYGCWHHQMLFELVNEALLQVYDRSLPYYPKPLSSSCYVKPFPVGNHIVDDVTTSIGRLMNLNIEEKQSLDSIVGRDLSNDDRWMNLQFESECTGFEIEDMIFDELLEEIICSSTFNT